MISSIWTIPPKWNADIVKMISDGTISRTMAKELLTTCIAIRMIQYDLAHGWTHESLSSKIDEMISDGY